MGSKARAAAILLLLSMVACWRGTPRQSPPRDEVAPGKVTSLPRKVLLVTEGNVFLEGAALTFEEPVDTASPAEFERAVARGELSGYGVIIFDDHTPRSLPPFAGALYFNPAGERAPFRVIARAANPSVVASDEHHDITRDLTFADTRFDQVDVFDVDRARGERALVTTDQGPIIAAGEIDGRRVVACGFRLDATDLPLRVAFPLFLRTAVRWLGGRRRGD